MADALRSFCFPHDDAFVIPVEALSAEGCKPWFFDALAEQGLSWADADWARAFSTAFAQAFERAAGLWAKASRYWFPPRLQNVLIVRDPGRAHAYFRSLGWSAWTLYADDFRGDLELPTYLFLHAERLNQLTDPRTSLVSNLSYFLTLDEAQRQGLVAGCAATERPDKAVWRALGEAMPWIASLGHLTLAPPESAEGKGVHEEAGLVVPKDDLPRVAALAEAFGEGAAQSVRDYYAAFEGDGSALVADLVAWLRDDAPELVLVDNQNAIVWDFREPAKLDAIGLALRGCAPAACAALHDDLRRIDEISQSFLASLVDPEALQRPHDEVDEEGGTYIHADSRRIAFDITRQTSWLPTREPTPPLQRLLLGARTAHEWSHLAEESELIRVPPERQDEHAAALQALGEGFDEILATMPAPLVDLTQATLPEPAHLSVGARLAQLAISRQPDFLANVVMSDYLEPAELDAYVRTNVRTHREERLPPFTLLARYAHEFQYLRLSKIVKTPVEDFFDVTACAALFVDTGLLKREQILGLFERVRAVYDAYELDASRFKSKPAAAT